MLALKRSPHILSLQNMVHSPGLCCSPSKQHCCSLLCGLGRRQTFRRGDWTDLDWHLTNANKACCERAVGKSWARGNLLLCLSVTRLLFRPLHFCPVCKAGSDSRMPSRVNHRFGSPTWTEQIYMRCWSLLSLWPSSWPKGYLPTWLSAPRSLLLDPLISLHWSCGRSCQVPVMLLPHTTHDMRDS